MLARKQVTTSGRCLDSTEPIYYIRQAASSDRWIIYLTSGYYCQIDDCTNAIAQRPHVTGTSLFPSLISPMEDSIADANSKNAFKDWNIAVLVYCSQDLYTGDRADAMVAADGKELFFQGSLILQDWIKELSESFLQNATHLLLAGSSAGGYGIMYNFQDIVSIFESYEVGAELNVLLDSSFIDIPLDFDVTSILKTYITDFNNSICNSVWEQQLCCIRADCMIPKVMSNTKVMGINGNYDWIGWGFLPADEIPPRMDYFDSHAIKVSTRM